MNFKKFISILLTIALSLALFTACNPSEDNGGGNGGDNVTPNSTVSITLNGNAITSLDLLDGQDNQEIEAKYESGIKDKKTVWTSSNESVVKITIKKSAISYVAQVKVVGVGTSTVTAKGVNNDTASITVNVLSTDVPVDKIDLFTCKTNDSFNLAEKASLVAGTFTYTIADTTIAKIENGVISPLKKGNTTVTVKETKTKKTKVIPITVYDSFINVVNNDTFYLAKTQSVDLPFITFVDGVEYTVANTDIAKIENDKLVGVAVGGTTITATYGNESKTLNIKVTEVDFAVSLSEYDLYLCDTNSSFDLKTVITPNTAHADLKFTSSNQNIITVDANGVVTPVSKGTANVSINLYGSNQTKTVKFNVYNEYVTAITNLMILTPNEEIVLPFTTNLQGVTYAVTDNTIATIVGGNIKGLKVGSTTLTATYLGSVVASVVVNVVSTKNTTYNITNNLNDENINYYGKNYYYNGAMAFSYGASGFEVSFYGTELKAKMRMIYSKDSNFIPEMQVLVDGEKVPTNDSTAKKIVVNSSTDKEYTLVTGLTKGFHTVKVLKRSGFVSGGSKENIVGLSQLKTDGFLNKAPSKPTLKMLVIGDSITHGYGNLNQGTQPYAQDTNGLLTYAYLAGEKLGADIRKQGHSGWGIYIRSSGEPDVNTQWYTFYDKYFKYNGSFSAQNNDATDTFSADIIVINLGTNDSTGVSKGTYTSATFIANYKTMIDGLKAKNPNAKFVLSYGMMGTNQTVMNDIKAVANSYDYVDWLNFSDARGGSGAHPLVTAHVTNGNELYNKIVSMLN